MYLTHVVGGVVSRGAFGAGRCPVTLSPATDRLSVLDESFAPALHALKVTAVTPTGITVFARSAFTRAPSPGQTTLSFLEHAIRRGSGGRDQ
jgi:hypothetical protein